MRLPAELLAPRSCAVCADPAPSGSLQPIGRDDALVWVCFACGGEAITMRGMQRYGERGYGEAQAKRDLAAGATLFRVRLDRKDARLTAAEAWNTILDTTGVRLLGACARWAYFERLMP